MLVAVLVHARSASARTGAVLAVAGGALVLANAWWHGYGVGPEIARDIVTDLPAVAGFGLIVAAVAVAPLRARVLTSRPVQLCGTLSYGIYLMHFLAIDLLRAVGRWPEQLGTAILAVLAIATAAAAVSWYLVERPALRWVRRRTATGARTRREAGAQGAPGRRRPVPAPARS
jgi:peptidoglycan/LPS O-acetylase OafA/YrhL